MLYLNVFVEDFSLQGSAVFLGARHCRSNVHTLVIVEGCGIFLYFLGQIGEEVLHVETVEDRLAPNVHNVPVHLQASALKISMHLSVLQHTGPATDVCSARGKLLHKNQAGELTNRIDIPAS